MASKLYKSGLATTFSNRIRERYIHNSIHTLPVDFCIKHYIEFIREYGSTLYVGIALKKDGRPYISIARDELK